MSGKKILPLLSVLALSLSSATAFAISSAPAQVLVTVPILQPGFEFSFAALALKPGASNLNYVIYNKELPTQSPSWTETELKPGFKFGFEFGGRFVFPQGNDINLTWTHLDNTTSSSIQAPSDSFFVGPDYQIGPDSLIVRSATGKAEFKYDVINLDAGQFVNFGQNTQMRFFGGLSNTYLRELVDATYFGNVTAGPFAGPFSAARNLTAKFTGIGPRIGMDGSYNIYDGFGVFGEGAISVLIGDLYSKVDLIGTGVELTALFHQAINNQFIKDKNITQVIPGFDAKLGLSYKHTFDNCMILTLRAGYQGAVYINAINQYLPQTLVQPLSTGGIFVDTMAHVQSNYSVQGPFVEASLQF